MKKTVWIITVLFLCLTACAGLAEWTNSQGDTIYGISESASTDFLFVLKKNSTLDSDMNFPAGTSREWLYLLKDDNTLVDMWSIATYKDTLQPLRIQHFCYGDQGVLLSVANYFYTTSDQQGSGICYIYDDATGNDYFAISNDGTQALIERYENGQYVYGRQLQDADLLSQYDMNFRTLSYKKAGDGWELWLDNTQIVFSRDTGSGHSIKGRDFLYSYETGDNFFTITKGSDSRRFYGNGTVINVSADQPTADSSIPSRITAKPTAKPTPKPTPTPTEITGTVISKIAGNAGPGTGKTYSQMGTWDMKGQQVRVISKAPRDSEKWWLQVEFDTPEGLIRCYTGSQRVDCTASELRSVPKEAALYTAVLNSDCQPTMGPGGEYATQYVAYDHHSAVRLSAGTCVTVYATENGCAQIEYTYRSNGLRYRSWVPLWMLD